MKSLNKIIQKLIYHFKENKSEIHMSYISLKFYSIWPPWALIIKLHLFSKFNKT